MAIKSTILSVFISELKRTFSIEGRTSRRQNWIGLLVICTINIIELIIIVGVIVSIKLNTEITINPRTYLNDFPILGNLFLLYSCIFQAFGYIFYLTQNIRRLHDLGHSGWFQLWLLVPLINLFIILYIYFAHGEENDNKYGAPPIDQKLTLFDKIWVGFWLTLVCLFIITILFTSAYDWSK